MRRSITTEPGEIMRCALCGRLIDGYAPTFNRLELGEGREAHLCAGCIDRFLKWQGERYARLFPTAAMKKRFKEREK